MLTEELGEYFQKNYQEIKEKKKYMMLLNELIDYLGEDPCNAESIESWLNSRPIRWTTWNGCLKRLSAIFNWLVKRGKLEENPCARIDKRIPTGNEIDPRWEPKSLDLDILKVLARRMKDINYQHYLILRLLAESGCRVSEALHSRREHLGEMMIYIHCTKNKQPRYIFFSEELGKFISEYIKTHDSEFIFPYHLDQTSPCTYDNFGWSFDKVRKGLYVPQTGKPVTIHMLRHTFASQRAGTVKAAELMQLMGHKSFQTTLGYIWRSNESMMAAQAKTTSLLSQVASVL